MTTRYGWHIISEDRTLGFHDGRKVRVGQRMEFIPRPWPMTNFRPGPQLCEQGMHASPTIDDARRAWDEHHPTSDFWKGWLCRVEVEGTGYTYPLSSGAGESYRKFVGTHRTVLGMVPILHPRQLDGSVFTMKPKEVLELMRRRNRRNKVRSVEVR